MPMEEMLEPFVAASAALARAGNLPKFLQVPNRLGPQGLG
jgi:hypothetical protein